MALAKLVRERCVVGRGANVPSPLCPTRLDRPRRSSFTPADASNSVFDMKQVGVSPSGPDSPSLDIGQRGLSAQVPSIWTSVWPIASTAVAAQMRCLTRSTDQRSLQLRYRTLPLSFVGAVQPRSTLGEVSSCLSRSPSSLFQTRSPSSPQSEEFNPCALPKSHFPLPFDSRSLRRVRPAPAELVPLRKARYP